MSERVLPEGWGITKLGALTSFQGGKTPSKSNALFWDGGSIRWASPKDMKSPIIKDTIDKITESALVKAGMKLYPSGSILLVTRSGILRHSFPVAIADGELTVNQDVKVIEPISGLMSPYLAYYLRTSSQEILNTCSKAGTTVNSIDVGSLERFNVPIASLKEQGAIVCKLDELLAQVNNLKTRLDTMPATLKRFRKSVLAAAVSGKLTRDFSSDDSIYYQEIEEEVQADTKLSKVALLSADEIELAKALHGDVDWRRWRVYPLSQLVDSSRGIPYGIVQTGDHDEDGIPVIRCGDVEALKISPGELKKVLPSISESYSRTLLRGGEVVLAIRGSVGNATVVPEAMKGNNISREVALIPVIDKVDARYIALVLQSPGGYRCLAEKVKGVAQKGINLSDVRRFVTPLPTLQEQQEIVRRVDQLFAFADQIEQQVKNAQARANKLTQSILAKAFRGDLTAEWRAANPELISGENSAEALLERIKAEKTNQKPVAKQRKQDAVGTAG